MLIIQFCLAFLKFFFNLLGFEEKPNFQFQGSKERGFLKGAVLSGKVLTEKAAGLVGAVASSL